MNNLKEIERIIDNISKHNIESLFWLNRKIYNETAKLPNEKPDYQRIEVRNFFNRMIELSTLTSASSTEDIQDILKKIKTEIIKTSENEY